MMDILPDLSKAKDFIDKGTSTTNQFIGTTAQSLLTAFNAGTRSISVSIVGQTAADIHYLLSGLNQRGYKASLTGSNTIQVNW